MRGLISGPISRDNDNEGLHVDELQMLNYSRPVIAQSNRYIEGNTCTNNRLPRVLVVVAALNGIDRVLNDNMYKKAYHVKVEYPLQPPS